MSTLLLIDGNAIMHRAYHALPPFKTKNGVYTNIIYGFYGMLLKCIIDFKPDKIVVCFDTPAQTFRNKMLESYQAQRPTLGDDFKSQIPLLHTSLDQAGIVHLEKDGYEADDIIGTIAKKAAKNNLRVLILTGDKDIMQLVDKNIFVITPLLGLTTVKLYDSAEVEKKLSVKPERIPDLKALMGDPSDNYPGAKGIGPKTAALLIEKFGTVENLLKNLGQVEKERIREILKNEVKNIELSKKLAQIKTDVALDFELKNSEFTWFKEELKDFFTKLEIKSLKERIFSKNEPVEKIQEKKGSEKEIKNQLNLFK